ncbi:hypothetical protein F511_18984 [Dorcoceras hygrometricum]|uniref:Uncharacterized protein n=1 Tax=Dorcoceras hygrometricum TaxID=472368 RepID=A0A2Z7D1V6_9LAMI|nr:hypothetical protein F511_18984 [Dorcoceras hygrometricum]
MINLLVSRRLAPTSFTRKPALQTVGGRSSIRSTTGFKTPSSACTRKLTNSARRKLLVKLIGTSPIDAVDRQSGPRPDSRHLRQPALERLTNSARTKTPRQADRNKSDRRTWRRGGGTWATARPREGARGEGRPSGLWRLGIQLAVGPQPLRLRNHNFGLAHRIMVKRLATSPHDPLGITDSACKNQLVVVSVQYGPFITYIPIRSTTIGKSRVARDPIAMHTSWRSNNDIASVTRTNQYNQDLGLIHSTNGNHLESPNEGISIDHQVIIYLHAQIITMFPTNETRYFASQILVSISGGLILILTAQSTRNEFRIHSDY